MQAQFKAQFIVVEGIEGAGKSTVIEYLKKYLALKNIACIQTREPGGTELAEGLRDLLKKNYTQETIYPETEVLLLYAARLQLVNNIIKPALAKNIWVIGDRHDLSTIAYQAGGRGVSEQLITNIKQAIIGDFSFDFCLYLDIDPKQGLERARSRGELDRIEQEDLNFFTKIRNKYLKLAQSNQNIQTIDSGQSLDNLREDIEKTMDERYSW
ncbi:MAG: dTMP kinase [Gammaproteobacteria bacterium]|nr:dTMP kinase [Gammaproteobacteria bacterium]